VVESSLDGQAWAEIDRKKNCKDFQYGSQSASFAVSNSAECRFIGLAQTGENHLWKDDLLFQAVAFFGTLLE
jgi:hypothetical protein